MTAIKPTCLAIRNSSKTVAKAVFVKSVSIFCKMRKENYFFSQRNKAYRQAFVRDEITQWKANGWKTSQDGRMSTLSNANIVLCHCREHLKVIYCSLFKFVLILQNNVAKLYSFWNFVKVSKNLFWTENPVLGRLSYIQGNRPSITLRIEL